MKAEPVKPVAAVKRAPAKKEPVVRKARPAKRPEPEDDDSMFSKVIIFAGIVFILLLVVLVRIFTQAPAEGPETVDMFIDVTCEYAGEAWGTMLELKELEPDAVIMIKHFPMSMEAVQAANAVQCARDQNLHMQYAERLFNSTEFDLNSLKNYGWAEGIGDLEAFHACIDEQTHIELVKADLAEGIERGVNSTPTFFVDGRKAVGLQPLSFFTKQ